MLQKGLTQLLKKYAIEKEVQMSEDGKSVRLNGQNIPLLPWESERRILELRNIFLSGKIGNICTYRIGHTTIEKGDLFALLKREIGILEFTTDSKVKEIFVISMNRAMNCILETTNGCICTIELGATLRRSEKDIDKHEIMADKGIACDRVVDTQIPQSSVYVFGSKISSWQDTDAELYGYSEDEINVIRNAFAVVSDAKLREENICKNRHIEKVVASAKISMKYLKNVRVEA